MGIMRNVGTWLAKRAISIGGIPPRDPVLAELWGIGNMTHAGANVTPDSALRVSAVYSCVKILSNALASLPFGIYRRGVSSSREIDTSHPIYRILQVKPNRWQTPFEFRQMMQAHLLLRGNAYAEMLSTASASVSELWPLHPDRVRPFRAPDGTIAYQYTPPEEGGVARIILQSEMFHLADLPLKDGIKGTSAISLHRETIGTAIAQAGYAARLFGNGAQPRGAIEVPAALDDEARKALIEGWERRHKGYEESGKIAILDAGMKWTNIGMSNVDAQFVDAMTFSKADIAMIFGIPPYLLGEMHRSSGMGSGLEQQNIHFLTYSLNPWLVLWEDCGNRDLLSQVSRNSHFCMFDVQGLLRGDFKTRMEGYGLLRQWGIANANECRARENWPPYAGGESYWQPLNMTTTQDALQIQLKAPAPTGGRGITVDAIDAVRNRLNGTATPEQLAALEALSVEAAHLERARTA